MDILLISQNAEDTLNALKPHIERLRFAGNFSHATPLSALNLSDKSQKPDAIIIETSMNEAASRSIVDTMKHLHPGTPVMLIHFEDGELAEDRQKKLSNLFTKSNGADIYQPYFARPDVMRDALKDLTDRAEHNIQQKLAAERPQSFALKPLQGYKNVIVCGDMRFLPELGRLYYFDPAINASPSEEFQPLANIFSLRGQKNQDGDGEYDRTPEGQYYNQYPHIELSPEEAKLIESLYDFGSTFTPISALKNRMFSGNALPSDQDIENIFTGLQNKMGDLLTQKRGLKPEEASLKRLTGPYLYLFGDAQRGLMLNIDADEMHPHAISEIEELKALYDTLAAESVDPSFS